MMKMRWAGGRQASCSSFCPCRDDASYLFHLPFKITQLAGASMIAAKLKVKYFFGFFVVGHPLALSLFPIGGFAGIYNPQPLVRRFHHAGIGLLMRENMTTQKGF